MQDAACRTKPTSWFFPGRGQSKRKALETCASCGVLDECAEYVERAGITHGIWAGRILRRTEVTKVAEPPAIVPPQEHALTGAALL